MARSWLAARAAGTCRIVAWLPYRISHLAISLANSARTVFSESKARDIELGQRNTDSVFASPTDHFAVGYVLAQIFANLASHDLAKAGASMGPGHLPSRTTAFQLRIDHKWQ